MSLATRCTACGTVFRVVQDQLRMSGGWVRCGRCGEVFNAVESLVEAGVPPSFGDTTGWGMGTSISPPDAIDAPLPETGPREPPVRLTPEDERSWTVTEVSDAGLDLRTEWPASGLAPLSTPPAPSGPSDDAMAVDAPAAASAAENRPVSAAPEADDRPPAPQPPTAPAADDAASEAEMAVREPGPVAEPEVGPVEEAPPAIAPSFLRKAEQAARWRRPGVRLALALVAVLAAAGLATQVALVNHDVLAARFPATLPLLTPLCEQAGCTIGPPRRIESLVVESSSLQRAGSPDTYRLMVVLRNRDALAIRLPSLDLVLNDARGELLARRVLDPASLGATGDRIAAGAEVSLAGVLRTEDPRVVGYTIEIFYP